MQEAEVVYLTDSDDELGRFSPEYRISEVGRGIHCQGYITIVGHYDHFSPFISCMIQFSAFFYPTCTFFSDNFISIFPQVAPLHHKTVFLSLNRFPWTCIEL